jgi:hypothetical protein
VRRPPSAEVDDVVVIRGKFVSGGDSEDVVVSFVEEASLVVVSALLDVGDGVAVEVADGEDLPSVEVSGKAGGLGACASTLAKKRTVIRNKNLVDANSRLSSRRIAPPMRRGIFDLQGCAVYVFPKTPIIDRIEGARSSEALRGGFNQESSA